MTNTYSFSPSPLLFRLCWHVANYYCNHLRDQTCIQPARKPSKKKEGAVLTARLLDNLKYLSDILLERIKRRLSASNPDEPDETETLPWFRNPDPFGLALEFHGRLEFAIHALTVEASIAGDGDQQRKRKATDTCEGEGKPKRRGEEA